MTTKNEKAPLTGEIVKEEEDEETPGSQELSIRRYLFPALLDEKRDSRWSTAHITALALTILVLAGILALYIYGGSLA
jgi:hypothetical protein